MITSTRGNKSCQHRAQIIPINLQIEQNTKSLENKFWRQDLRSMKHPKPKFNILESFIYLKMIVTNFSLALDFFEEFINQIFVRIATKMKTALFISAILMNPKRWPGAIGSPLRRAVPIAGAWRPSKTRFWPCPTKWPSFRRQRLSRSSCWA